MNTNHPHKSPSHIIQSSAFSTLLQSFHKPLVLGLALLFLLAASVPVVLYKVLSERKTETLNNDFTQRAIMAQNNLSIGAAFSELAPLFANIRMALDDLYQQQYNFLESKQPVLVGSVYQEMALSQALLVEAFQKIQKLNESLRGAIVDKGRLANVLSEAQLEHQNQLQLLKSHSDHLSREIYKFSWQFDEVITASSNTLQIIKLGGFDVGMNHFSDVGATKAQLLNQTVFRMGFVLEDMKSLLSKNMEFVSQKLLDNQVPVSTQLFSQVSVTPIAIPVAVAIFCMFTAMCLWFYTVLKSRLIFNAALQQVANGHLREPLDNLLSRNDYFSEMSEYLKKIVSNTHQLSQENISLLNEIQFIKCSSALSISNDDVYENDSKNDDLFFHLIPKPLPSHISTHVSHLRN